VGSNTRGRTFLFEIDGFLYQAHLNYYAEGKLWDMSPGYEKLQEMERHNPDLGAARRLLADLTSGQRCRGR
jgi:hypothetical protein